MASKSVPSEDIRIGSLIENVQTSDINTVPLGNVLLGHADDEGIRLNNGRPGSSEGPEAIRRQFFKLTPGRKDFPKIFDFGNLSLTGDLSKRQLLALDIARSIFKAQHRLLALGGGHDHAFSDVGAFLEHFADSRPLVINIDAHLDLRPLIHSPTSGTPFYQLLESYPRFDFVEIGIQQHSNSLSHLDYAKKKKIKVYDFKKSNGHLAKIFKSLKCGSRPVFLSIDIDAFSSAYAPGASAASPIGLDPHELLILMPYIAGQLNVRGFGIYEVSPPLDRDNQTAKLAAILLQSFLLHVKK